MNHLTPLIDDDLVEIRNADATSSIVLVCEHASAHIPSEFEHLGLGGDDLQSHIAWDPGAKAVASHMAAHLNATLVAAKVSRLVYDCNRPPVAQDAIPERSELVDIPGNTGLSSAQRAERAATYYDPFRSVLSGIVASKSAPILETVHSFTPVYLGKPRAVEIGVLHDSDARLADALLSDAVISGRHVIRRNDPYGPDDGVTHTLKEHALPGAHLNVMLELRNDLIADAVAQTVMAETVSHWIRRALAKMEIDACRT